MIFGLGVETRYMSTFFVIVHKGLRFYFSTASLYVSYKVTVVIIEDTEYREMGDLINYSYLNWSISVHGT